MSAVFNITIQTNTSGVTAATAKLGRDLDKVKQKAIDVNGALRSIFGIYALRELVTGITGLANSYQSVENKIRTVTSSQANLNGVMAATYKIAQDTRTAWGSTTVMYQRLALNSKTLGASQKEMLDFTKRLNEEVIVSGATSKEASSGIIQLAQGMAAGRLHGQDLRAVMEDLPGVVDIIAKHFHTTRGALYQMGAQGTITAQEIMKAFKEAGVDIDENFNKTVPTMAQSMEMVKNAAEKFFGEAGTGSGVLAGLASVLKFVADHFDTIGKVVLAVVQDLGGLLIISEVIKLFKTLSAVIAANPFTSFVTILAGAVLLLRQFGDQIDTGMRVWQNVPGVFVTIGDELRALWQQFKDVTAAIGDFLKDGWNKLTGAFSDGLSVDGIQFSLENVIKFIAAFVYSVTAIFRHLKDLMIEIFGGIPVVLAAKFDESFSSVVDGTVKVVNSLIKSINFLHSLTDRSDHEALQRAENLQKRIDALDEKIAAAQGAYHENNLSLKTPFGQPVGVIGVPGQTVHLNENKQVLARTAELVKQQQALETQRQQLLAIASHGASDLIPELKFDHEGVKGAADAFKEFSKENLDAIRKDVVSGLDSLDKLSKDIAAKRIQEEKKNLGIVSSQAGTPAAVQETSAQAAARRKLEAELDALIKRGQKEQSALQQLRDAEKLLNDPAAEGILETKFGTNSAAVLDSFREKLSPILDQIDKYVDKTIESTAAMKGSREQEELDVAVLAVLNKAKQDGVTVTEAQANEVRRVTALQQDHNRVWREEQRILEELQGPEKQYVLSLRAIQKALDDQTISQHQANMAREQAARTLLNGPGGGAAAGERGDLYKLTQQSIDPDALVHGFDDGINHIMQSMLDMANTVSSAMQSTFQGLEKFIIGAAETGKFAWDDLANTIIEELNKVALKILETWLLTTLLNSAFGGGGAVGAVVSAVNGNSAGPLGANPGVSGPITSPHGYASGGSYVYPGNGGLDSRSVMFRLTPGERVDFTPPGRTVDTKGGTTLGPRGRNTETVRTVVVDGRSIISALNSSDAQKIILNLIAKNREILK